MSRGFVKEDDQEEAPFIPPRASLPRGVTNYVTPTGFEQLQSEKKQLDDQLSTLNIEDEKEKRHTRAVLTGKLNLLNERINSARLIDLQEQSRDEVRFGATVTFEITEGEQLGTQKRFQLVGVDEADIKLYKISFVAPIAASLTGKRLGETAQFKRGTVVQEFRILKIEYPS